MEYTKGTILKARINKITDKGCFCTILPISSGQFGFMPYSLMPSLLDGTGTMTKSKGDEIDVAINKVTDKGIVLSDMQFIAEENFRLHKERLFAKEHEIGQIIEATILKVNNSNKIHIDLGDDIHGVIKKEEACWNEIEQLQDLYFAGEVIRAKYIGEENNELLFSTKHLNKKPYDELLYDLDTSGILQYLGHNSNEFIGQAKQYHYGLFIENLYSTDINNKGKLLVDPIYGYNLRALVPNANFGVEEGKFYKVSIKISPKNTRIQRNQLFQFISTSCEEAENPYKADVALTFAKSTSPRDCAALAHTLEEVGKNMYSSKDRMFFELIQNADDASSEKGVSVKVNTIGEYLTICHNGFSFDRDDFGAITSSANGTKKANENKTGYKGIGFKSVFTDSEIVYIKTGGYQFRFDKKHPLFSNFEEFYYTTNGYTTNEQKKGFLLKFADERNKFTGVADIPWQLEPIWADNYPEELGEHFASSNVAIALKLGENKIKGSNGYKQSIEDIICNPKFMLFLRKTQRIDFNDYTVSKTTIDDKITLKNSFGSTRIEYFKRNDFEISVNNKAFEDLGLDIRIVIDEQNKQTGEITEAKFVDINNHELENIPKKIAINNSTIISFAISINGNGKIQPNIKCNEVSLFAFLPTLVKDFMFPFYINANFILDPPREKVLGDNPWNFYLMGEIASKMVKWCAELNSKQDKNALNILVTEYFEENTSDIKHLSHHFNTAYKTALETEAFILNHKGELAKQDEIIIDCTDLSTIIGADLFCKIISTSKCLPSDKIDSTILENKIFEQVEKIKFDKVIDAITRSSDFNNWFVTTDEEKKQELYKWIKNNDTTTRRDKIKSFVSTLPIFQFGNEHKSSNEIKNSNYIVTTKHIEPAKNILGRLGFNCSAELFDGEHPLFEYIATQTEEELFKSIKENDFSNLSSNERKTLFVALKDFTGVGEAKLKDIKLFKNINGEFKPLSEMAAYRAGVPAWMNSYIICKEEYSFELQDYLIKSENEFTEIIQKYFQDIDVSVCELYQTYKNEWTSQFTRHLIDNYEIDDNIFAIIEESDKATRKYFLEKTDDLKLQSTKKYGKESIEYRTLQIALNTLSDPSDFSSKIFFDGQCIKNFSVSDDVICEYTQNGEKKKVKMSLSKLLPRYENISASINKVKDIFETKTGLDKFFNTTNKDNEEIASELASQDFLNLHASEYWPIDSNSNAYQYLFYIHYYRHIKEYTSWWVKYIKLKDASTPFINEMMDFLFENKIDILTSPFTYRIHQYFKGKCILTQFAEDTEKLIPAIEQWADNDSKKQYLKQNGVKMPESDLIRFRQLFIENKPNDYVDKLSEEGIKTSLEFFSKTDLCPKPFNGENQKNTLIAIKDKYKYLLSEEFDIETIKNKTTEWEDPQYVKWTANHSLRIFIYDGDFPRKLSYRETILSSYVGSDFKYYHDNNSIYIKKYQETIALLELSANGNAGFTSDDYVSICLEDKITISKQLLEKKDKQIEHLEKQAREKEDKLEQKINEIEQLKEQVKELEEYKKKFGGLPKEGGGQGNPGTITGGPGQDLPQNEQWAAQLEAQQRLKQEFQQWNFPERYGDAKEDNGEPYNGSTVTVTDKNTNEEIYVVLKSYKKRDVPFKINTNEWDYLLKNNAVLLIYTGDDIKRIYVKDLIREQSKISISFSTKNISVEERVSAFADSLHYFKGLHFDLDSFNISTKVQSAADLYKKNKRAFFANDNTEEDI